MSNQPDNPYHQSARQSPVSVVLVNLGTPSLPTAWQVSRFLARFLSDRRVVGLPAILWRPLLYLFVIPLRCRRVAKAYRSIWMQQGSPLMVISRRIQSALLSRMPQDVDVHLAMRYGKPGLDDVINQLEMRGTRRVVLLPMFPQYAACTTATIFEAFTRAMAKRYFYPHVDYISGYAGHEAYIAALVTSVQAHYRQYGKSQRLIIAFHGLPKASLRQGDPYYCFCRQTARCLTERLGLDPDFAVIAFQSRFGASAWLEPYADDVIKQFAQQGIKHVDVICPSFAVDCLETLEEVEIGFAECFISHGGQMLRLIPCLNDADHAIDMYAHLLAPYLKLPI